MKVVVLAAVGLFLVAALPLLAPGGAAADDVQVTISHPGVVFHKIGSSDLRGQGVVRGLEEAQAAGYLPCQVCFGRVAPSPVHTGSMGLSAGVTTVATASVVHIGPGLNHAPMVSQPFGLRAFGGRKGGAKGSLRNPYDPLVTIRNPGKEAGAFSSEP